MTFKTISRLNIHFQRKSGQLKAYCRETESLIQKQTCHFNTIAVRTTTYIGYFSVVIFWQCSSCGVACHQRTFKQTVNLSLCTLPSYLTSTMSMMSFVKVTRTKVKCPVYHYICSQINDPVIDWENCPLFQLWYIQKCPAFTIYAIE